MKIGGGGKVGKPDEMGEKMRWVFGKGESKGGLREKGVKRENENGGKGVECTTDEEKRRQSSRGEKDMPKGENRRQGGKDR